MKLLSKLFKIEKERRLINIFEYDYIVAMNNGDEHGICLVEEVYKGFWLTYIDSPDIKINKYLNGKNNIMAFGNRDLYINRNNVSAIMLGDKRSIGHVPSVTTYFVIFGIKIPVKYIFEAAVTLKKKPKTSLKIVKIEDE